jgi:hypothetical protein
MKKWLSAQSTALSNQAFTNISYSVTHSRLFRCWARGLLPITRLCQVSWNLHFVLVQFRINRYSSQFLEYTLVSIEEALLSMLN